jgi:UDP-2-acetamido-2-deoxy-ribo-hexuluronate aminotransferase
MEFIDLKTQYTRLADDIQSRVLKVFQHGQYILGPEVSELEGALADFVGVKHCIGVANGTDALLIAMLALGIKAGDEIITTPFSFIATSETIALLGATPVYVDVCPRTYNLNPELLPAAISPRTKAIMPVSLYGQCADFTRIAEIAAQYGIPVIEDGAQSFGATHNGIRSCGLSQIGCTSFFPSKPLGAYGDAGACFTDNDGLATAMRQIRIHGQDRRYHHARLGINGRLDTLQAAVLLAKFSIFAEEITARQEIGARYSERLANIPNVTPPYIAPNNTSVYGQYTIQLAAREHIQEKLKERGVPTAVHYPILLNKQPAIQQAGYSLPVAQRLSECVLSLPMSPYLSQQDQDHVINALEVILG